MQTKKIVVVSCTKIKDGYGKNGKPWTLWSVKDEDGVQYSTFSPLYEGLVGIETTITYEEKQSGRFTNRTIVEPNSKPRAKESGEGTELLKEILAVLKDIRDKDL